MHPSVLAQTTSNLANPLHFPCNNNIIKMSWEELMGSNNWAGLLEPELNQGLREFILRCGNLCQATYDCFNSNKLSPNCGNSRYGIGSFFTDVMLQDAANYKVVAFLYATSGIGDPEENVFFHPGPTVPEPWDRQSNWMGYVAVTTDKYKQETGRREVYVAWRGTITDSEWTSNLFRALPSSAGPLFPTITDDGQHYVHGGWLSIYTKPNESPKLGNESARMKLHRVIQDVMKKYKGENLSVVVTGHSLGGALATVSAGDLVVNKVEPDIRVSAFVFGCPQVGNQKYKKLLDSYSNLKILHIRNSWDIVPKLPDWPLLTYIPIQTAELLINTNSSPYLRTKRPADSIGNWHNLEANLHVVAWWNGWTKRFDYPKAERSLALVNKSTRYLIDEAKVPEYWWIEKNKGMEYNESTKKWVLDPPLPEEQMLKINLGQNSPAPA